MTRPPQSNPGRRGRQAAPRRAQASTLSGTAVAAALVALALAPAVARSQAVQTIAAVHSPGSGDIPPATAQSQAQAAAMREYKIGADDVLTITVWHEPDLSRSAPVRPDGMISMPLVGEVTASGKTTTELESELKVSLGRFIKAPEIYIVVSQIRSRHINILGEVQHPGTFTLMQQMGVLDAIAGAGGLRDFAKKNKIYVLREQADGRRERLAYAYQDVVRGKNNAHEITLQPNDTVVVP